MTELKPDIFHQLLELIGQGQYEPICVWNDYYSKWDDEMQTHFDFMLLGAIVKEQREGREWEQVYHDYSRCYKYLSQKRCEITEQEITEQAHDLRQAINDACQIRANLTAPNDAIEELTRKIEQAAKYYR